MSKKHLKKALVLGLVLTSTSLLVGGTNIASANTKDYIDHNSYLTDFWNPTLQKQDGTASVNDAPDWSPTYNYFLQYHEHVSPEQTDGWNTIVGIKLNEGTAHTVTLSDGTPIEIKGVQVQHVRYDNNGNIYSPDGVANPGTNLHVTGPTGYHYCGESAQSISVGQIQRMNEIAAENNAQLADALQKNSTTITNIKNTYVSNVVDKGDTWTVVQGDGNITIKDTYVTGVENKFKEGVLTTTIYQNQGKDPVNSNTINIKEWADNNYAGKTVTIGTTTVDTTTQVVNNYNSITNINNTIGNTENLDVDGNTLVDAINNTYTEAKKHTTIAAGSNIVIGTPTQNENGGLHYTVDLSNDIRLRDKDGKDTIAISGSNGTITGLTNTTWDNTSVDPDRVATEGQLQNAEIIGGSINDDGTITLNKGDSAKSFTLTNKIHDYALVGGTYAVADNNTITLNIQDKYNANNNYTATIENVAKHSDVGDVKDIKQDGTGNTSGNTVVSNINNIYYQLESGWDAQIDGKTVNNVKMGEVQNFVTGDNMVLSADESGAIKIGTKSDVTFDRVTSTTVNATTVNVGDSVTINDNGITIENGDNDVIVSKTEVNVGGNKITNVHEGDIYQGSMDAVNGGQLWQTNQRLDSLDNRVDKVGAGAAALAALHPLDFDPDDKLSFSAGVGNYAGATASAIGAFYRPDERTMFSIGGTIGNGENMVNAGVSFALGKGGKITNTRVATVHEINDLRQQVAELTAIVSQLTALHSNFKFDSMRPFPDTPENHWAYEYVAKLAAEGIIEGYPDGNFSGDRDMTRYEYAAMLYRALEKGFQLDERIIDEFEPELGRLSVERIKGELNQKEKVERVRLNDKGEDRDVYGGKITVGKTWP